MDGFTYHNIFETKGIEYLVIIAFFLVLIPFWIIISKRLKISQHFQKMLNILSINTLRIPQGLYFNRNHMWAFLEKSGIAKVGIDELLLQLTGEVKFKILKQPGETIKKGDVIAELNHQNKKLTVHSPVSGQIEGVNPLLTEHPESVVADPYDEGWMYKIKPTDWKSETHSLLLATDAIEWTKSEIIKFKDFISRSSMNSLDGLQHPVLQDGGELVSNTLAQLPDEVWNNFQKEFLNDSL